MRASFSRRRIAAIVALVLVVPFAAYRLYHSFGRPGIFGVVPRAALDLSAAQARSHIGAYAVVTGTVADVSASASGTTFIDFGSPYPSESLTAVIFPRDRGRFPSLAGLAGKLVRVTGRIDSYHGGPEMILTAPGQLIVVN